MLGTNIGEGKKMEQFILKDNEKFVPHCLPRPLQAEEIHSAAEQKRREIVGRLIKGGWGTLVNLPPTPSNTENETNFGEYYN